MTRRFLSIPLVFFALLSLAFAQGRGLVREANHRKKLANGLTVIICERPEAPVFSFYTFVNAGSVQDPYAKTGLAHMFEHMAFKGTDTIGTTDYSGEKLLSRKLRRHTPRISPSATRWLDKILKNSAARKNLEGCDRRCRQIRQAE